MSILTTLGSGSGIDTTQLISDLISAQRAGADTQLKARQTALNAKVSSLAQISSALSSFSTSLTALVNSGALGRQVTSGDASIVTATASGSANPESATYSMEVQQLASRQAVASTPVQDKLSPVGQGTLTFTFGTMTTSNGVPTAFSAGGAAPVTITIGPDNDSLVGVAQAINNANAGLSASVVQDSAGARLVVKGATGEEQAFTISGSGGLSQFNFGPGQTGVSLASEAKSALISVDGVVVKRSSNTVTDLIDGVTLDLKTTNVGSPIIVSSSYDATTLKTAVSNYVDAYNELSNLLSDATKAGADGAAAGPLNSDSTIRDLKRTLSQITSQTLLSGSGPSSLAEIGIKTNRDGTLSIDDAMLTKAVTQYPERVHDMFVPGQTSSTPLVSIASNLGAAKPGTYAVTDLVPATSGKLTGTAVPGAFTTPVVIDSSNNSFTVNVDGRTSLTIQLPQGSYASGASLAAAFQSAINSDSVLQSYGASVGVSWDGSAFTFTSRASGMASKVEMSGMDSTLAAQLGLAGATSTIGTNVSGKIAGVNGIGIGDRLVASALSNASGLSVKVYGGATSATVTVRTTIAGLIAQLQSRLTASDGGLTTTSTRLTKEGEAIQDETDRLNAQMDSLKARLTTQFAAMEKAVASFKSTQSYLQQQIDIWTKKND